MLRLLVLAAPVVLSACTSFNAGAPPVPRGDVVTQPVVPVDIRPLTEDQRAMLDG